MLIFNRVIYRYRYCIRCQSNMYENSDIDLDNYLISVRGIKDNMNRQDFIIIDIRSRKRFYEGHILGAVWIDIDELFNQFDNIIDAGNYIVLYCDRGNISLRMAVQLDRYYKNLKLYNEHEKKNKFFLSLVGGYYAWMNLS